MRSVLSKSIHALTAWVYTFVILAPSLSLATQVQTQVEEERPVLRLKLPPSSDPASYTLKITKNAPEDPSITVTVQEGRPGSRPFYALNEIIGPGTTSSLFKAVTLKQPKGIKILGFTGLLPGIGYLFYHFEDGIFLRGGEESHSLDHMQFETDLPVTLHHLTAQKLTIKTPFLKLEETVNIPEVKVLKPAPRQKTGLSIAESATLKVHTLFLQEGDLENQGTIQHAPKGTLEVKKGDFYNKGTFTGATGSKITLGGDFLNSGLFEGALDSSIQKYICMNLVAARFINTGRLLSPSSTLKLEEGTNLGELRLMQVHLTASGGVFTNESTMGVGLFNGPGTVINHGRAEDLFGILVSVFRSETVKERGQSASLKGQKLDVTSPAYNKVDLFLIGEGSEATFDLLDIKGVQSFQNKGTLHVNQKIFFKGGSQGQNFGVIETPALSIAEESSFKNEPFAKFKNTFVFFWSNGHFWNKPNAKVSSQNFGPLPFLFSNKIRNEGKWSHKGDFHVVDKCQNTGFLKLKDGTLGKGTTAGFTLENAGTLSLVRYACGQEVDASHPPVKKEFPIALKNSGVLKLEEGLRGKLRLENTGTVSISPGRYEFATLANHHHVKVEPGTWQVGLGKTGLVLTSEQGASFLPQEAGMAPLWQNTGTVFVKGGLTYHLLEAPGVFEVQETLTIPRPLEAGVQSLKDLTSLKKGGILKLFLKGDLVIPRGEEVDLTAIKSLHLEVQGRVKIFGKLKTQELFLTSQGDFDLGEDNDHFGSVLAHQGALSLKTLKGQALNVKYGHLYSQGDMTLATEGGEITLGEFRSQSVQPFTTSLGPVGTWHCDPYTIYHSNQTWVATLGRLNLISPGKVLVKGGLVWAHGDLFVGPSLAGESSLRGGIGSTIFHNIAGHIIVFGKGGFDVQEIQNKRLPVVKVTFPQRYYTYSGIHKHAETSRAAQLHIRGDLATQAPTFYNNTSLIHVGGDLVGATKTLYQTLQGSDTGKGWRNVTNVLTANACHHRNGWDSYSVIPSLIEPEITGKFIVGGAFLPPTLAVFENSGLIEARMARILTQGPITVSTLGRATHGGRVMPLDQFVPKNGLFGSLSGGGPSLLGSSSQALIPASSGPRLILSSAPRRLGTPSIPRSLPIQDSLSPAGMTYAMLTGILPLLPFSYQTAEPTSLLKKLQQNALDFVHHLQGLEGRPLLEKAPSCGESSSLTALVLRHPEKFLKGPQASQPMLAFVEEEIDGVPTYVPWVAIPEAPKETGVIRTHEALEIISGSTFQTQGATFESLEDTTTLGAQGSLITGPFIETTQTSGGRDTLITTQTALPTKVKGKKSVRLLSTGENKLIGTEVESEGAGHIKGKKVALLPAQSVTTVTTFTKEKSFFKKETTVTSTSQSQVVPVKARVHRLHVQALEGIDAQAPDLKTLAGIDFETAKGKVVLTAAQAYFQRCVQRSSQSWVWNEVESYGEKRTQPIEGIYDPGSGPLKIQAPEGIDYTHGTGADLTGALASYLKSQPNVVWKALEEEHETWHESQSSLGGPLAAVLTLAVGALTAGAGSAFAGSVVQSLAAQGMTATMLSAGLKVGFQALCSSLVVGTLSNQGDVGKTLQDMTTGASLRQTATTIATAALSAGILEKVTDKAPAREGKVGPELKAPALGVASVAPQGPSLLECAREGLVQAGVTTGVHSTLGGQDFGDALEQGLRQGAATTVGRYGASQVGLAKKLGELDEVSHKVAHGVIGAGMAKITGGEAVAGAIGAVVGEMVGQKYRALLEEEGRFDPEDPEFNFLVERGVDLSRVSAAFAAFLVGQDPTSAAETAGNAVRHNALSLVVPLVTAGVALYEGYEIYDVYVSEGPEAALQKAGFSIVTTVATGGVTKIGLKVAGKVLPGLYPSVEAAWAFVQSKSPTLSYVAQKCHAILHKGKALDDKLAVAVKSKLEKLPRFSILSKEYLREMEKVTGLQIPSEQRSLLKKALQGKEFVKLEGPAAKEHRKLFDRSKLSLQREWELKTGKKWPRYESDVIGKKGLPFKAKGEPYDAHEIIPNSYGGPLEWWNIHPAKCPDQHQRLIHGKDSRLNQILKDISKEGSND